LTEPTEIITEPEKVNNRAWEMVKSARDELLILFSSANALARQERIGGLEPLKQLCTMKKELQIKILIPKSQRLEGVRSGLKNQKYNIYIKYVPVFSQTKISMIIVDRESSLVIEVKNDNAIDTLEAMGQSPYSTRILTVLSYVSLFESYWTLSELYEGSENELPNTKEYLNKVLNELDSQKK
jgi:hypothetical protein